jgi:hypothetical protein
MEIKYFRNLNRIFDCADYDWNMDAVIQRSNHVGTQLAATISDFCTAVSQCSIITNHEGRITTLETNFADLYSDFYGAGGYLDNKLSNIVNNFSGVSQTYVLETHTRTDLSKNANVSSLTWDQVNNTNSSIATLGWVKREVALIEPDGVAWLNPPSKGLTKNTFGGMHDFTATGTSLLYKTVLLEMPSWEVASTMFVNQSLAKLNNLPIVTIGQPQSTSWNKITWSLGFVSIAGIDYVINANLTPFIVGNTSGVYYLYYNPVTPNLTYQLAVSTTPINDGLVAKITLLSDNNGIVWQPSLDLTKLARLISPNLFTGSNIFTKDVTFGTLNNDLTRAKALYPLIDSLNDNTLITASWTRSRINEARDAYWSLIDEATDRLIPKTDIIVDLRSRSAWASTPTEQSPSQAIATKQYVLDMSNVARDAYWSLIDETTDRLIPKTNIIVDLRSRSAWASTPTEQSPLQAIATKEYVLDMFQATLGIPIVTLVNIDPPQIEWTSGVVKLPLSLATQLNKEECMVPASQNPMTISASANYIYVDYTTCAVVYSCDAVNETVQGKIIAVVRTLNGDPVVSPTPDGGLAPIESPLFKGDPRVPTPNDTDCDTTIPNTQWVCDKIFNLIHGSCGNAFPRVYQINTVDGLQLAVGVTSGGITHSSRGNITIAPTVDPIGCVATTKEYCWIRYKDDPPYYDIVISASIPSTVEGILIATLTKNGNVINIEHADIVATETTISANYRAAWGGKIVYIGPVQC